MQNKAMAEDMAKFCNRVLILKTDIEENDDSTGSVIVYEPSEEDIQKIQQHKNYREGSIKIFRALDKAADKGIYTADHVTRNYVAPAAKATGRGAVALGSMLGKAVLGAVAGAKQGRQEFRQKHQEQKQQQEPEIIIE